MSKLARASLTGAPHNTPRRVVVFGATGTAGRGAVRALLARGFDVTCIVRTETDFPAEITQIIADVTHPIAEVRSKFGGVQFDVVVSCLASRTGGTKDAWAIDYAAQLTILNLANQIGVSHFILLSAICVQKPDLPFQHAKLAFEKVLIASGLTYSIVRPTAFFKSLSGQIDRVRKGKPFLVFGDGTLTACKPISDDDLGQFIAGCIDDPAYHNRILPVGGPGPAITPMDQADALFGLLNRPKNVRHVPVTMLSVIYNVLRIAGWVFPKAAEKAELARIGRFYATESMLVFNPKTGRYDADATPSSGTDTLFGYYSDVIAGDASLSRGDHSVF